MSDDGVHFDAPTVIKSVVFLFCMFFLIKPDPPFIPLGKKKYKSTYQFFVSFASYQLILYLIFLFNPPPQYDQFFFLF